ncbi:hypothetical protein [Hymenobacter glacieicola]|uniref:Uncharacterized protein n=1 Tax=Hymenobacter glacieicola TaxID=1562124 RepID=A0ABQ1X4W7_9BACT|nr:hypothetical protein [Hymenobacter glacieicola]GGG60112.1 hypothetical protein GCM10011378_40100 [Hymenobacter glacieicola]
MPFKLSFPWGWLAAPLAYCLVRYVANPNDHSIVPALLGLLFSFLQYVELRGAVALGKNWIAAYLRIKHEGFRSGGKVNALCLVEGGID